MGRGGERKGRGGRGKGGEEREQGGEREGREGESCAPLSQIPGSAPVSYVSLTIKTLFGWCFKY